MQIRQRLFHAVADLSALTRFLSHINTPDLNSIRGTRIGMNLDWQEFQKAQTPRIIQIWGVWKGERKKKNEKVNLYGSDFALYCHFSEALLLSSFLWLHYSEIYNFCEWTMFFDPYTKWYLWKNEYPGSFLIRDTHLEWRRYMPTCYDD